MTTLTEVCLLYLCVLATLGFGLKMLQLIIEGKI